MRQHFDLDDSLIYLNSGTQSITPRLAMDALIGYQKTYEKNPTDGLISAWPQLWQVQKMLAAYLNADPKDLFLRPNVTHVLNIFILGSKLNGQGGEILTTDLEYGAILNIAQVRCARDGLTLRKIQIPTNPENLAEMIISQLRPETRMLLLSHVATGTGLVFPLEEISRETRKRGIILVVDGAHAAGAVNLDFKQLGDVDFYGANLHKWMLGPKGTAFGWAAKRHQDSLDPLHAGWTTFESVAPFAGFGEGSRFASKLLMLGCHDFAPYFALKETLNFWQNQTPQAIHEKRTLLQKIIEREMNEKLGWINLSPPAGKMRGPLMAFELPARLETEGYGLAIRIFKQHRLQVATPLVKGKSVLRLSPHIYNTDAECVRAMGILKGLV